MAFVEASGGCQHPFDQRRSSVFPRPHTYGSVSVRPKKGHRLPYNRKKIIGLRPPPFKAPKQEVGFRSTKTNVTSCFRLPPKSPSASVKPDKKYTSFLLTQNKSSVSARPLEGSSAFGRSKKGHRSTFTQRGKSSASVRPNNTIGGGSQE